MVEIVLGAVAPVQNNQSRNDRHRSTPKKKTARENRRSTLDDRAGQTEGDYVTLSRRPGRLPSLTY